MIMVIFKELLDKKNPSQRGGKIKDRTTVVTQLVKF